MVFEWKPIFFGSKYCPETPPFASTGQASFSKLEPAPVGKDQCGNGGENFPWINISMFLVISLTSHFQSCRLILMKNDHVAHCLEALGNPTRLSIFRLLVQAGKAGAAVGELQRAMSIPGSTLSHHISKLVRVGLVSQERQSRTLICRANYDVMGLVIEFLTENCCKGLSCVTTPNVA